ncbi:MAG: sugar transferase [Hyphomonadaceae bacterium]|nr:sugar transferase [Hyphomonadaceae bacterium]
MGVHVRPTETAYATQLHRGGWRKRAFDVAIAALGLLVLAPLFLVIAALIKLQDGGPVVFGHWRVGFRGRAFRCWKFRSMRPDAEGRLEDVLAADPRAAAEWGARRKLSADPRVTRVGKWMRRLSLDELPQLWNVLAGEMSLVGPRPVTVEELARFGEAQYAYLNLRPGISGLWQVSGRSDVSYEKRVLIELSYWQGGWRLSGDLVILLKTIPLVLSGRGAY